MLYIGLDYHTKSSYISIIDEGSREILHESIGSQEELPGFLRSLPEDSKVLFEAGYGWPRLINLLGGVKAELIMCQPDHNRRIAGDRRKSDRRDARNLAIYLKTGGYKRAYIPDEDIREERQLTRGRTSLREMTTSIKNRIHSILAYAGVPKESGDIFCKRRRDYLESLALSELTRDTLDFNLKILDQVNDLVDTLDARIAKLNKRDPRARLLKTIPGVGDITARVLLAEIGDVTRFDTDDSFACYSGLTPRQHQSSEKLRMMGLTKEGSTHIRWVLVQAAWNAVRLDPALREIFDKLKEKKNPGKAICAVARRLAVAVWHVLSSEAPYRARRPKELGQLGTAGEKPKPMAEVSS